MFPSKQLHRFILPPVASENSDFAAFSPALLIIWLFYSPHLSGCELVSLCGFGLSFLMAKDASFFFSMCWMADLSFKLLVIDGFLPKGTFLSSGSPHVCPGLWHSAKLWGSPFPHFHTSRLEGTWREHIHRQVAQTQIFMRAPPLIFSTLCSFSCQTQLSFSWSQFLQTNSLPDHQLGVARGDLVKGWGQTAIASCAR